MTELEDKDVKTVIITIYDMFKKIEKSLSMLTRNREDIKKTQAEHLEKKNTMSDEKHTG